MNYDKDYRKNGLVQYDAALELLAHIPFKPTNLLDIGCGSGRVTALICDQRKPCRVTGIDSSPVMIKEAQLLYPLPNVTYTESTIEGLGTRDQFDVITANSSFQWFSDYSKAFKIFVRAWQRMVFLSYRRHAVNNGVQPSIIWWMYF